jgi:hypothetical protein
MRVLDYDRSCQVLLEEESGKFDDWASCVVQDGGSVLDIFFLTRDYVVTQFSINEMWMLRAGLLRLPQPGTRRNRKQFHTPTGWDVLLRDLPFLQEDRLQRNCCRKIIKIFFARALGIYGHDYARYWPLPHNALAA